MTSLDLRKNPITEKTAKALALSSSIISLNLFRTKIGDEGVKALALNSNITDLNIAAVDVGDDGIKALSSNDTIKKLNLSYNPKVSNNGIKALTSNSSLVEMSCVSNNCSITAFGELAKAVRINKRNQHQENKKFGEIVTALAAMKLAFFNKTDENLVTPTLKAASFITDYIEKPRI